MTDPMKLPAGPLKDLLLSSGIILLALLLLVFVWYLATVNL